MNFYPARWLRRANGARGGDAAQRGLDSLPEVAQLPAPSTKPVYAHGIHGAMGRSIEFVLVWIGWLVLPVLPVMASAVARDWSYVVHYPGTLKRISRHILATWRSAAVSRAWVQRFDKHSDSGRARIVGSCTHCGNCCLHRDCVFLGFDAEARSFCRIYGSAVWRKLPCGAYPVSQRDIELYSCPSFRALPQAVDGRKVIPIQPAFDGARAGPDGSS
jgi:hypothetical protein